MSKTTDATERSRTIRELIRRALLEPEPCSLRDLSQAVSLREKDLIAHLEHVRRSARRNKERFVIKPASCRKCDYAFEERTRFTTPSRCPSCKHERIEPARFVLRPRGQG